MKWIVMWITGIAGGLAVAAGLFTFLAITGVAHRLMVMTHTSSRGNWYEWMFIAGGIMGNLFWLWEPSMAAGAAVAAVVGLFIGIFVGCLIGAIAEVLDAFPIFLRRAGLKTGIALVITGMALGKAAGVWLWYFVLN